MYGIFTYICLSFMVNVPITKGQLVHLRKLCQSSSRRGDPAETVRCERGGVIDHMVEEKAQDLEKAADRQGLHHFQVKADPFQVLQLDLVAVRHMLKLINQKWPQINTSDCQSGCRPEKSLARGNLLAFVTPKIYSNVCNGPDY